MTSLATNSSLRSALSSVRGRIWLRVLIAAAFLLSMVAATHAQTFRVEGAVRDSSGASIAGAQVELHAGSYSASTTADSSGEFAFEHVPGISGTVIVNARGFDPLEKPWTAATGNLARLEITLVPSAVNQSIIVTATRSQTLLSDVPLSDIQLTRSEVQAIPALTLDDTLRQIPGFSLFRRASS
ncbi:MAG TPA: carboxypeptidase regulatory-like domain-containing protein, partial [Candidatus Angelobacter sp.]|nr:carboxypeptidase regulatory-like domain-containing protein [Candidatus Angelobacter sp.]